MSPWPTTVHPAAGNVPPDHLRPTQHEPLVIDCDECAMHDTEACADCVVTFICGRDADDAVVIDLGDLRAMRLLADAGLVPELRHRRVGR